MSLARRIPRPSAAIVVSFVALFTALSGTGYAALKITGSSIVNGTVRGADVKDRSLGAKEHKPNSLTGKQIKESKLGTVPSAGHAADADALGGNPASAFMTKRQRAFEAPIPAAADFANHALLGSLADLQPGAYVVTAKLSYDNDGATQSVNCTLRVPGDDDTTSFIVDGTSTETIMLQKVTTSDAVFSADVTCSGSGDDDVHGTGRIIAVRLD
jgi:hypothetical protein